MALQLGVAEEAIPETSSTLVWERYAIEKSSYEDKLELYKIRFKEANETFPHENRPSRRWRKRCLKRPWMI